MAPPEQGQLVKVRSRQYVVTEVRQTTLPPNPIDLLQKSSLR
ncbi:MAG TPA: hypothetical protein V6D33_05540 [Cyanophyceae cyanobacterium]